MLIGEVAERAGVTVKAVRYYESLGLVTAPREGNGYRTYDEHHLRRIREIRTLGELGISADRTRPFLDCLDTGAAAGDDCPASLDAYREAIADMTHRLDQLGARRDALVERLARATVRVGTPAPPARCAFTATEESR
ncbi:MerR family transcriptional regulator [Nocardioides sp. SYSU D00038]|uniref:MerR family transcriptional regulator n=1 Tax=Nocardioides sp. SYSU D00038 TaxID=2812554 RepID=UPI001967D7ED|nr:MerR family transcriptional regulator [Nocardioides sp. SYSU D00038]